MKIVLFGATGMVGQGVLRECLLDPIVEQVLAVGRNATGQTHEKLRELVRQDLLDYSAAESQLRGFDACFFCLGVASAGMTEQDYRRVTFDITMAAARTLARLNPQMTFIFVSGAGTDGTARGRVMWARVKGETENALRQLPFKASYAFRPGLIRPLHGIRSKTRLYRWAYAVMGRLFPVFRALVPSYVTTTEQIGRAMILVAVRGAPKPVLESADINAMSPA